MERTALFHVIWMLVSDLTRCHLSMCACIWLDADMIGGNAWWAEIEIELCRTAEGFK